VRAVKCTRHGESVGKRMPGRVHMASGTEPEQGRERTVRQQNRRQAVRMAGRRRKAGWYASLRPQLRAGRSYAER